MSSRYVEPRGSRHRVEMIDGVEQLRVPYRRQWLLLAFLPVWLAGWTAGGFAAMRQVIEAPNLFLTFWLVLWAGGWVMAASQVAMQLGGTERLRVVAGDLEVSNGIGAIRRTWRYRSGDIEHLRSYEPDSSPFGWGRGMERPFFLRPKTGTVKFDYGAESVFLAMGVDEPEGREIVAWLERRLPAAARY